MEDKSDIEDIEQELEDIENDAHVQKKPRLMPQKKNHRMRAHINPLNTTEFPYPLNTNYVNWRLHYPLFFNGTQEENEVIYANTNEYPLQYKQQIENQYNGKARSVDFLDVGCGYGGLLFALGEAFPNKLSMGLEIRGKVVNYVAEKIRAYRIEEKQQNNISVLRTNAMRHICQYFRKGSVEKLFFCFPDPHFKTQNHRRRIVNPGFLTEYAYILKPKGRIYCITDVEELHKWHAEKLAEHSMFEKISEEEEKNDICVKLIQISSEESKKVDRRKEGEKWANKNWVVYQRKDY